MEITSAQPSFWISNRGRGFLCSGFALSGPLKVPCCKGEKSWWSGSEINELKFLQLLVPSGNLPLKRTLLMFFSYNSGWFLIVMWNRRKQPCGIRTDSLLCVMVRKHIKCNLDKRGRSSQFACPHCKTYLQISTLHYRIFYIYLYRIYELIIYSSLYFSLIALGDCTFFAAQFLMDLANAAAAMCRQRSWLQPGGRQCAASLRPGAAPGDQPICLTLRKNDGFTGKIHDFKRDKALTNGGFARAIC